MPIISNSFVMPTGDAIVTAEFEQISQIIIGDVNGDGTINIGDVNMLYLYVRGRITLSDAQLQAADVNGDGKIDIGDVNLLYLYVRGRVPSLQGAMNQSLSAWIRSASSVRLSADWIGNAPSIKDFLPKA